MSTNQNSTVNSPDRFLVYASRLKDSPYTSGEDEWPRYLDDKVSNLAHEIVNGNNTCYLVSGYRGVGKTSFILQVQEKSERILDEKRNNNIKSETPSEKIPECLFILTNFAKYENHKSLLRRMIRDVYQVYKQNEPTIIQNEEQKKFRKKIEDLYKRTFQDIKSQLSTSDSTELKIAGEADISAKVKEYASPILQLLASGAGSAYIISKWATLTPLTIILFSIVLILLFISSLISFKVSFTYIRSKESKNTIEEIYDDEIADFKFQELLDSFHSLNYRLVFVLDELDKVSTADLDNLMKEMKPYLLSGKAHFIIVAGQELAYRYLWAYSGDDAVIGSLFSKFYHVPLFSRDNLEEIGKRLINLDDASPDSISKLSPLFDYLIFKCRRVPRSFIARFRQMVMWEPNENKERTAYITIPDKQTTELQVQTVAMIKEIERLIITPKQYDPVLNDYLITQLFINAQQMIFKKDYPQSLNDYLEHYSKSDQLADKAYYQNVEEIIRDLFNRMKQENIVKEKTQETKEETKVTNDVKSSPQKAGDESEEKVAETISKADSLNISELQKFKIEWVDFIGALTIFWDDELNRKPLLKDSTKTNYAFLEYFNSIKAISFTPIHAKTLIDIVNNPNLLEGNDRLASFKDQLRSHSINPLAFKRQLTEFVIRQQLKSKIGENYNEQTLTGFDAAFINSDSSDPDLLIDFRHSESSESDRSDIEKIVEKLSDYNTICKKGNIILVIETFFNPEAKINPDLLINDFNTKIENLNPPYYKKILYYPVSDRIEKNTFGQLMNNCVKDLIPYSEFSISERVEEKRKLIPGIQQYDFDDPQKLLWNQRSEKADRSLSASVVPIGKESKKFAITLTVRGSDKNTLRGFIYFLVHPTFPEEIYKVLAKNNFASLDLEGYEAFTTGVVCDEGATELELNLNTVQGLPTEFYYQQQTSNEQSSVKRTPQRSKSVKKRMKK